MIDSKSDVPTLGNDLHRLADALVEHGEMLWSRTHDWVKQGRPDADHGPDTDEHQGDGASDVTIEDRIGDASASRYHDEVKALLRNLDRDGRRLKRITEIVCPAQPRVLQDRDLLAAQVAGEGWCVSCYRDHGHLEPVHEGYYRDACRFCGEWKAANGQQAPPMQVIRWRHRHPGKRVPLSVVEQATGKAS